jgi:hypothetical protein
MPKSNRAQAALILRAEGFLSLDAGRSLLALLLEWKGYGGAQCDTQGIWRHGG